MPINRRELVAQLVKRCEDALIVTGLGSPTYDVAAAGDRPENFYLWGAMGGAAMLGLGVALAQPQRRVIVVTGDGEALMGLGAFATIAAQKPANLAVLILDNERFCETGGQSGLTAGSADLAALARGAGIEHCLLAESLQDSESLIESLLRLGGPVVAVAKIDPADPPRVLPPRDGAWLHQRFRQALDLPLLAG